MKKMLKHYILCLTNAFNINLVNVLSLTVFSNTLCQMTNNSTENFITHTLIEQCNHLIKNNEKFSSIEVLLNSFVITMNANTTLKAAYNAYPFSTGIIPFNYLLHNEEGF